MSVILARVYKLFEMYWIHLLHINILSMDLFGKNLWNKIAKFLPTDSVEKRLQFHYQIGGFFICDLWISFEILDKFIKCSIVLFKMAGFQIYLQLRAMLFQSLRGEIYWHLAFGIWWLLHLHLLQTPLEGKEGRMENTALQPLCTRYSYRYFPLYYSPKNTALYHRVCNITLRVLF